MNEIEFSHIVAKFLNERLATAQYRGISLVEGVDAKAKHNYIVRHFTFQKGNDGWKVLAGADDLDIILYKDVVPKVQFPANLFRFTGTGVRGDGVIIPLVTIELKVKFPSTHDLIASNKIASDIKTLFPHCRCYFLSYQKSRSENSLRDPNVLRLAQCFDRSFIDWENIKEDLWQKILSHLKDLKQSEII